MVENSERNQNSRKRFHAAKAICRTFSPSVPTIKDKNGKLLDNSTNIRKIIMETILYEKRNVQSIGKKLKLYQYTRNMTRGSAIITESLVC